MKLNLIKPYPLNASINKRWLNCLTFSGFVFLFLYIFKPFELSALSNGVFLIAFGYGMVCFVIMALLNVAVYSALPNYFSENKWTSKRELLWSLINILCIGLGNFIYSVLIGIANFSLAGLFWFETYTIAIGVFPITATVLVNQARLNRKFEGETEKINPFIIKADKEISNNLFIQLLSNSGTDELKLLASDFLFARADDNYVEVYYLINDKLRRKLMRNTLKNITNQLPPDKGFFRCHKSYIVNLNQVKHISGNAQGYKLHLMAADGLVPVSRSNNEAIKQYFTNRP